MPKTLQACNIPVQVCCKMQQIYDARRKKNVDFECRMDVLAEVKFFLCVKISNNIEICNRMLEFKEMYNVYIHVYNEPFFLFFFFLIQFYVPFNIVSAHMRRANQ